MSADATLPNLRAVLRAREDALLDGEVDEARALDRLAVTLALRLDLWAWTFRRLGREARRDVERQRAGA